MSVGIERLQPWEKAKLVSLFKGMSNQTRMDIIDLLRSEGELRPTDIAVMLGEPQANVSYHLTTMLRRGHLIASGEGRERFYSVSPKMAETIDHALAL